MYAIVWSECLSLLCRYELQKEDSEAVDVAPVLERVVVGPEPETRSDECKMSKGDWYQKMHVGGWLIYSGSLKALKEDEVASWSSLDTPASATFAMKFSSTNTFDGLKLLCTDGGCSPCKWHKPALVKTETCINFNSQIWNYDLIIYTYLWLLL